MHHQTPINGPKSDHPASGDGSYPVYPVLSQSPDAPPPQGSYGYGLRPRTRGCLCWKLRVVLLHDGVVNVDRHQADAHDRDTPSTPASYVAIELPQMDRQHSLQLVRSGNELQLVGHQDQGPTYVTTLSHWIQAGTLAALA